MSMVTAMDDLQRQPPIHPELRRLHSPDLWDMRSQQPDDPRDFGILVEAMIGPRDGPGEESFDFVLCTPSWLARLVAEERIVYGRHYLFVARYDYDAIFEAITRVCDSIQGETWQEVGERLARYGKWEFEDYREYVEHDPLQNKQ